MTTASAVNPPATLSSIIIAAYPQITFVKGAQFRYSPKDTSVTYVPDADNALWPLLHEIGHALNGHQNYSSDYELVKMEVEAWDTAVEIAPLHNVSIDPDYVQDCLDSYRDWVHQRSTCPACGARGVQKDSRYSCLNCKHAWQVSASRFCRIYRRSS